MCLESRGGEKQGGDCGKLNGAPFQQGLPLEVKCQLRGTEAEDHCQQAKALTTRLDSLSSIPGLVAEGRKEGRNQFLQESSDFCRYTITLHVREHVSTLTHISIHI